MAAVEARGVSVTLGGNQILTDVDLQVTAGELVALVGPNGAGKSTLLGALSGDLDCAEGDVLLAGRPLAEWSLLDAARMRAVQQQHTRVSFSFTTSEVVRMGRAPWRGTPYAERDDETVAAALMATDTDHLARRRILTMSGGEVSRASFARALVQEAGVLLLDEPTTALDIRHQELVLGQARDRARAGAAVVVVLHDLSLAGAYSDRIVVLEGGRVRADAPPRDVLRAELLSDVYRHPIAVIDDPHTGAPIVLPIRERAPRDEQAKEPEELAVRS